MALNFEIETRRIAVGKGGFFDVRGITADDFTFMTGYFLDDLKGLAAKYADGHVPADQMTTVLLDIAKSFPTMASEIIFRCADAEEEDRAKFLRLPFAATIKALKAIADLTLEDGGVELGNVLAAIAAQLDTVGLSSGPLMKSLNDIISASAKTSPS